MHRALIRASGFLANLGFPTVYAGEADTAICFGENARSLIGKPLPEKLILDSVRGTEIGPVGNLPFVYRVLTNPRASVSRFSSSSVHLSGLRQKKDGKTVSLFLNFSADTVWDDAELLLPHPSEFIGNETAPKGRGILSLRHPVPLYSGFLAFWEAQI